MIVTTPKDWKKEFGLENRGPPYFISDVKQLDDSTLRVPYPQILRCAFEQLHVDGVLCMERNPVIYFRQMPDCNTDKVLALHRAF